MNIRVATKNDVRHLASLMGQLGYPTSFEQMKLRFENIHSNSSYHTLIAEIDGDAVGMVGLLKGYFYEHDGIYVRILAFVVHSNYRRKGVGERLMIESEKWAREQGAIAIGLNSGNRTERVAAHHLYTKMGFEGKSTGFSKRLT